MEWQRVEDVGEEELGEAETFVAANTIFDMCDTQECVLNVKAGRAGVRVQKAFNEHHDSSNQPTKVPAQIEAALVEGIETEGSMAENAPGALPRVQGIHQDDGKDEDAVGQDEALGKPNKESTTIQAGPDASAETGLELVIQDDGRD
jgi:hypothetical protein